MAEAEGIRIRDARPEDAPGIAEVHIVCWQEAYAGQLPDEFLEGVPESFDRRERFWRGIAAGPAEREALLVAELAGAVVGFAHVCRSRDEDADESEGEVTAIYLRKQWWGRGIGRDLFKKAVDRLRAFGFTSAILWVLDSNARTRRFYEAAGWKLNGGEKVDDVRGIPLREVRYRVSL